MLKVLVVDDEPGIRSGIKRILKSYSVGFPFMEEDFYFDIIEASTGEDAIETINKQSIDIVLLDNKLPGIEGVEVLEYINKKKFDISVMIITSYASLDLAVKSTRNGAYNFVPKPFTPDELKSAIENITKHLYLKRMTNQMNDDDKQIKFQFLSVLSHELKSPIDSVEGYIKMMHDKEAGNNVDDYLGIIDRSLARLQGMRHLINDLLNLTKIESGEKAREISDVDLTEILKFSKDTHEPLAEQKKVKIYLDSPEHLYISADRQEIEIVFNNLISNAIKYNIEEGYVNISIKDSGRNAIVTIEDTGIGMSMEDIAKLFHDFVRIKNIKTRSIVGTGLGLSIVKKIIELYKGKIDVSSTPGKGSIFTITIPK